MNTKALSWLASQPEHIRSLLFQGRAGQGAFLTWNEWDDCPVLVCGEGLAGLVECLQKQGTLTDLLVAVRQDSPVTQDSR